MRTHLPPPAEGRAWPGRLALLALLAWWPWTGAAAPATPDSPETLKVVRVSTNQLGSWIWSRQTYDKQTCRFWRSIEIPAQARMSKARLWITADNTYALFLDGREIGRGSEWRRLTEYDLTQVLEPGPHVLAVECFNDYSAAGLMFGLEVKFTNAPTLRVVSDESWRIIPNDVNRWESKTAPAKHWEHAIARGVLDTAPWGQAQAFAAVAPTVRRIDVQFWQQGWFQITLAGVCAAAIAVSLRLTMQLAAQRRAQGLLQLERARIARDFHDDLGARITQLVLLGEVARRELPAGTAMRGKIDQMCERMRELSAAMKEVVWVVNSQRDTLHDFANHLTGYAETFLQGTPIRCRFDVGLELPDAAFDLPVRRNLFLAVKEALNNVAKHSHATELSLRIHWNGELVEVVVEDNGRGFDLTRTDSAGHGIANMAQRMAEFGGECRLASEPGKGSRVTFKMPLSDAARGSRWLGWREHGPSAAAGPLAAPAEAPRLPGPPAPAAPPAPVSTLRS